LFLLFEHQSHHEPWAVIRASEYKNACYRHQQKQGSPTQPVICVIFYHGDSPWRTPDNFGEWLQIGPQRMRQIYLSSDQKEYILLDVSRLDVEKLEARARVKAGLELLQSCQNGTEAEWLAKYAELVAEGLNNPSENVRVLTLIRYCLAATHLDLDAFQNAVKHLPYAQTIMNTLKTTGEKLWEQGHEKGEQKGLRRGVLIGTIQQIERNAGMRQTPFEELSGLSLEELEQRRKRLDS